MRIRAGRLISGGVTLAFVAACVPDRPEQGEAGDPDASRPAAPTAPPSRQSPRHDAAIPSNDAFLAPPDAATPGAVTHDATGVDAWDPDAALPDAAVPATELACDGEDEDRDGRVDEDLGCYVEIYRSIWNNHSGNMDFYYAREPGWPPSWLCSDGQCGHQGARFLVYAEPGVPGTVPLHILFDELEVDHILTIDDAEVDARVGQGTRYLGLLGFVYPANAPGRLDASPLLRLHNSEIHTWLFTVDQREQHPPAFEITEPPALCCRAFATAPPGP